MAFHDSAIIGYAETKIVDKTDKDVWELGAEVVPLAVNPDGLNINRKCGAIAADAMMESVVMHGAHLGLALKRPPDMRMGRQTDAEFQGAAAQLVQRVGKLLELVVVFGPYTKGAGKEEASKASEMLKQLEASKNTSMNQDVADENGGRCEGVVVLGDDTGLAVMHPFLRDRRRHTGNHRQARGLGLQKV